MWLICPFWFSSLLLSLLFSGESRMSDADKQAVQGQLKMNSVKAAAQYGKMQSRKATAAHPPEEGAYHTYKHSNFVFHCEYMVAVL